MRDAVTRYDGDDDGWYDAPNDLDNEAFWAGVALTAIVGAATVIGLAVLFG